jgi:hypothetical protein
MHGMGLELDVRDWFPAKVPRTTVKANFVRDALRAR